MKLGYVSRSQGGWSLRSVGVSDIFDHEDIKFIFLPNFGNCLQDYVVPQRTGSQPKQSYKVTLKSYGVMYELLWIVLF
jgi:hypothetical protein